MPARIRLCKYSSPRFSHRLTPMPDLDINTDCVGLIGRFLLGLRVPGLFQEGIDAAVHSCQNRAGAGKDPHSSQLCSESLDLGCRGTLLLL